jgi:NADPH2:quinone reductase
MPVPATMPVVEIVKPGGPEVLVPATRPVPVPVEGQILIAVAHAGVNRPDVLQRQGGYAPPPGASDLPGLEVAGTVVARGPGATRFGVGAQVMALVAGGGYAAYAAVHETNALPVPQGLSLAEAAAIPETYFTVWHNVFERGALKSGETLLVHGGTSGIGTTAIQLAKAFGSRVIATAAGPEKGDACRALGADLAIDHRTQDFVAGVKAITNGRGADVILDMVGGDYIPRNYEAAAEQGRIVQIAFLRGPKVEMDFRKLMMKRLVHTGSTLRPRTISEKAAIASAIQEKVVPLLAAGRCKPVMFRSFPLARAADAHTLIETNTHIGKIVLDVA